MEIVKQYSQVKEYGGQGHTPPWQAGYIYEMLQCAACSGVALRRYHWHDFRDPDKIEIQQLYPTIGRSLEGLPASISKTYDEALQVRSNPNAYGALCGRILELVCLDRGAAGRSLANKLKDLAKKGEIPAKLVEVAIGLKNLRNVAAHPGLGELTAEDVPILDELTRAILEYVYSAQALAARAEARLAERRSKNAEPPPRRDA
jgi:uncharacterized protein DUF4145